MNDRVFGNFNRHIYLMENGCAKIFFKGLKAYLIKTSDISNIDKIRIWNNVFWPDEDEYHLFDDGEGYRYKDYSKYLYDIKVIFTIT